MLTKYFYFRSSLGDNDLIKQEYFISTCILRKEFEIKFTTWVENPILYPNYEEVHAEFSFKNKTKLANKNEDYKEKLWTKYWRKKINKLKQMHWNQEKQQLFDRIQSKYSEKSNKFNELLIKQEPEEENVPESKSHIQYVKSQETEDEFSVEACVLLLSDLISYTGSVSDAFTFVLKSFRKFGFHSLSSLLFMNSDDNKSLFDIVEFKLNSALKNQSNHRKQLQKAVLWLPKLRNLFHNIPSSLQFMKINLIKLTNAYLGKSIKDIESGIKTAFLLEVLRPPKQSELLDLTNCILALTESNHYLKEEL